MHDSNILFLNVRELFLSSVGLLQVINDFAVSAAQVATHILMQIGRLPSSKSLCLSPWACNFVAYCWYVFVHKCTSENLSVLVQVLFIYIVYMSVRGSSGGCTGSPAKRASGNCTPQCVATAL